VVWYRGLNEIEIEGGHYVREGKSDLKIERVQVTIDMSMQSDSMNKVELFRHRTQGNTPASPRMRSASFELNIS